MNSDRFFGYRRLKSFIEQTAYLQRFTTFSLIHESECNTNIAAPQYLFVDTRRNASHEMSSPPVVASDSVILRLRRSTPYIRIVLP